LSRLLARGLAATAALWPTISAAYGWVHRVAHLLDPERAVDGATVQREVGVVVAEMAQGQADAGPLALAIGHFLKVTTSYWPGLFHCYDVTGLPRTNNDLEHLFGSARYYERRATGRKGASPGMVVRGAVRIIAAVASQGSGWRGPELRPLDLGAWRRLRCELDSRHLARRAQSRFRRHPVAYLAAAEAILIKQSLPP